MDPIEAAIDAIESREPGESFSYSQIAKDFGVVRSTLIRRHRQLTQSYTIAGYGRRVLSPQQENSFLEYIKLLTERGLPPTRQMNMVSHRQNRRLYVLG